MKTEWICTWQLIPGGKEHREAYPTMRAAHTAMAKVLTSAVPLNGYVQLFRNEEGEDCIPSADFLKKVFLRFNASRTIRQHPSPLGYPRLL